MSGTPPTVGRRVPRLGEDTEAVLREIGLGDQEIAEIRGE
jgi:crotonobetainyl-CoA:carnitine CoA-transferase CaiB-like acyl-CoA transferase